MNSPLEYLLEKNKALGGYVTKLIILSVDLFLAMLAYFTALLAVCRFNFYEAGKMVSWALVVLLVLRAAAFVIFKTYLIVVRYLGERDYKNMFFAIASSSAAFWLSMKIAPGLLPKEELLSVTIIDFAILFWLAGGFRILLRLLIDKVRQLRGERQNTIIYGAGELGAMLARVLKYNDEHNYRVVAFLDDNPKVHLKSLNGIRIFNPDKEFVKIIRRYQVKIAIIGVKNLPEERRIAFIKKCLQNKVKVLKVPPTEDWFNNQLNVGQLKDIRFEDLLNRPPIQLDETGVRKSIKGKTLLVTGCAGSIGSEIVRQLLRFEPGLLVGLDQAETPLAEMGLAMEEQLKSGLFQTVIGDVRDYDKMRRLFEHYKPDYVFHAAAYKHVPIMEQYPDEAIKSNIMGTRHIADLAASFGARKFVMISTDKVVNPSNIMGASKRIAEMYVQSLNYAKGNQTQFITTRFGNVLGSNGSVIPIFKRQIENRKPVTVTHPDIKRFFMTIPEACQLVLEAGAMGKGGEIFIFDMGDPVRIADLAEKMIQMAGLTPGKDIEIVYTGLRPGEKLFEELLDKNENSISTHHPKIQKAQVRTYPYDDMAALIEQLIDMALAGADVFEIVKLMKTIVPEFSSQNSDFSKLDKTSSKPSAS